MYPRKPYYSRKERTRAAMHKRMPAAVGRRMARAVQRMLFVSRQMVRQVVPQGKWKRVKNSTDNAVAAVQPLAVRRACSWGRLW